MPNKSKIVEYINAMVIAILAALFFRSFIFEAYKIPSGSMIPSLMIGDRLFVSKFSYGYSKYSLPISPDWISGRLFFTEPQRGDIIVFRSPNKDDDKHYIKRLIGLPGDLVKMKGGNLFINNKQVIDKRIGTYTPAYKDEPSGNFNHYEEILPNGINYDVLYDIDRDKNIFPDNTAEYKVPADHYFFMGDNRNRSADSRFLQSMGFIPKENLVGKALFLFWTRDFSIVKMITEFKMDRLFKNLTNENILQIP